LKPLIILIKHDVASLAHSVYEEQIKDGSFFADTDLIAKYFQFTDDVVEVFTDNGFIN